MKTPEPPKENPSAPSKRHFNRQGQLFEAPPVQPTWPNPGTLDAITLETLLTGKVLTHPAFQAQTQSWRLAACIDRLVKKHGWPIERRDIPNPVVKRRSRCIREYAMRADGMALVKGGVK
jgi:hypothetical protein